MRTIVVRRAILMDPKDTQTPQDGCFSRFPLWMETGELGDRHLIRPRRGGDKLVALVARYGENVIKNEGESVG